MFFGPCTIDTYLRTPRCRVLLEKLTGLQQVKKFPAFYGIRRFITVLTSVRHLSLSWASPIQSTYPHPTSWRSILILSTHLRLGLHTRHMPSPSHSSRFYHPHNIGWGVQIIKLLVMQSHNSQTLNQPNTQCCSLDIYIIVLSIPSGTLSFKI